MEMMAKKACHAPPMVSREKDRISELPDEILRIILSRLEMKEAARTCVLSHSWRDIWKLFTGRLNFEASDTMKLVIYGKKQAHIEVPKYRDWVNQVLDSHEGLTIESFRIAFDYSLGKYFSSDIDKWIDFAIVKRVQELQLNLRSRYCGLDRCYESAYTFPSWLLNIPMDFPSFDRLTSLCLMCVSISEEDLAYFLSNCLLLRWLFVENSSSIQNVRIAGESLKLKHLEIRYCLMLKNIKVSATSLVSFKYAGPRIEICFENVPQLSSISLGVDECERFVYQKSLCLSQLEKLKLDLKQLDLARCQNFPKHFPEFSNLKDLVLKFIAVDDRSILFLSSIIGASPNLHRLKLKYEIYKTAFSRGQPGSVEEAYERKWKKRARKYTHKSLNVIEFVGWLGLKTDIQFANYLLESATSLEKIIVNRFDPCKKSIRISWSERDLEEALSSAMQLERKLPPRAKLIVT